MRPLAAEGPGRREQAATATGITVEARARFCCTASSRRRAALAAIPAAAARGPRNVLGGSGLLAYDTPSAEWEPELLRAIDRTVRLARM